MRGKEIQEELISARKLWRDKIESIIRKELEEKLHFRTKYRDGDIDDVVFLATDKKYHPMDFKKLEDYSDFIINDLLAKAYDEAEGDIVKFKENIEEKFKAILNKLDSAINTVLDLYI